MADQHEGWKTQMVNRLRKSVGRCGWSTQPVTVKAQFGLAEGGGQCLPMLRNDGILLQQQHPAVLDYVGDVQAIKIDTCSDAEGVKLTV
jgi:hypothetical protein